MTTSSRNAELTPAYILHSRKYRDTSLIAELLTERDGRVSVVMRGVRGPKKKQGVVQPFTPLLVSYMGRGELKTMTKIDAASSAALSGENLLIGLYVNELLVRLLGRFEAVGSVFGGYQRLLVILAGGEGSVQALRHFELQLLSELGYGITFDTESPTGDPINADDYYQYVPDAGFSRSSEVPPEFDSQQYKGELLLGISRGNFDDALVENCAKKIIRVSLAALLGGKPLKSRELFKSHIKKK